MNLLKKLISVRKVISSRDSSLKQEGDTVVYGDGATVMKDCGVNLGKETIHPIDMGSLNSGLSIEDLRVTIEISAPDSSGRRKVSRIDRYRFKAAQPGVSCFSLSLLKTHAKGMKLFSVDGVFPVTEEDKEERAGTAEYSFKFLNGENKEKKLKTNEEHRVTIGWSVEDISEASFYYAGFRSFSNFKHCSVLIIFKKEDAKEFSCRVLNSGCTPIIPDEPLKPYAFPSVMEYEKEKVFIEYGGQSIVKADKSHKYQIEWKFNNLSK